MFLVNIKRYRNLYTVDGIYSREVRLENMEKRPYILFLNVYKKKIYIYIYMHPVIFSTQTSFIIFKDKKENILQIIKQSIVVINLVIFYQQKESKVKINM